MATSDRPLDVLAFEPFDSGSHRAVRESISRHSRHQWRWFTRPGRAWKWRMRLAAIELVDEAEAAGGLDGRIDVIFATSLLSAADLIACLPARLRHVPVVLYMHENQVVYPAGCVKPGAGDRDVHFALTNLTSVLAADLTIFNSEWNRRSFLQGICELLRKAPDAELGDVSERIAERSMVIWPPVEPPPPEPPEVAPGTGDSGASRDEVGGGEGKGGRVLHNVSEAVRVVWPHRWEHDKGPDELLRVAEEYSEALNLRWTILGERFGESPGEMAEFERRFAGRIDHMGYVPGREEYWSLLSGCDWVLSTARHEFFGIAVVEALLAGCLPWLPMRLSYPELAPGIESGASHAEEDAWSIWPGRVPDDSEGLRARIREHLEPAIAGNAVGRLDEAIGQVVAGR